VYLWCPLRLDDGRVLSVLLFGFWIKDCVPLLSPQSKEWRWREEGIISPTPKFQMARELGMNPQKLGKIDNHRQKWKAPLPEFIEHLYFKRFGKRQPDRVIPLEERAKETE
jgi:hypothetical protein